jgi:hypothetical protein
MKAKPTLLVADDRMRQGEMRRERASAKETYPRSKRLAKLI